MIEFTILHALKKAQPKREFDNVVMLLDENEKHFIFCYFDNDEIFIYDKKSHKIHQLVKDWQEGNQYIMNGTVLRLIAKDTTCYYFVDTFENNKVVSINLDNLPRLASDFGYDFNELYKKEWI